jgi:hypothetical protein
MEALWHRRKPLVRVVKWIGRPLCFTTSVSRNKAHTYFKANFDRMNRAIKTWLYCVKLVSLDLYWNILFNDANFIPTFYIYLESILVKEKNTQNEGALFIGIEVVLPFGQVMTNILTHSLLKKQATSSQKTQDHEKVQNLICNCNFSRIHHRYVYWSYRRGAKWHKQHQRPWSHTINKRCHFLNMKEKVDLPPLNKETTAL